MATEPKHYLFELNEIDRYDEMVGRLTLLGFENIYTIESDSSMQIGAYSSHPIEIDFLPLISCEAAPSIDWEKEWEAHAPNYANGYQVLELSPSITLKLAPGPGFGDLSHPTTQLCLEKLQSSSHDGAVVDLGSGSGILSIAASLLGSSPVYGIEIDSEAIEHAKKNTILNPPASVTYSETFTPEDLQSLSNPLFLLNMTFGEQCALFNTLPHLSSASGTWVISGLLEEQDEKMLTKANSLGWKHLDTKKRKGWALFVFTS